MASAAWMVAHAVFYVIGVIGMSGPILILDVGIVLAALIDIIDDERDRRAGRHLLAGRFVGEYAGENSDCVRLLTLGREARLTGTAAIEERLYIAFGECDARRTTVDHAADRRPVAFTRRSSPEKNVRTY